MILHSHLNNSKSIPLNSKDHFIPIYDMYLAEPLRFATHVVTLDKLYALNIDYLGLRN